MYLDTIEKYNLQEVIPKQKKSKKRID